jgi:hypothetical protein
VIEFKGRGSGVGMHYSMLGFRCAKYPEPTRDVMMQQLAKLEERRAVPLDPAAAKNGVRFDASRAYGVELDRYAPPGSEGKGKVFVTGATKIVSFVPVEHLPFSTVKHLVAAQEAERKSPDELPVILGLLTWNADLAIDIVEMVEQQPAAPEQVPGPGEEPDGKGADGGAKTPDAPAEKPKPGVDKPRNTDDKPKAGGDKPKPAGDKPKPGGEKAKEGGEKPGPGPAAPPAGPTIVPTRTILPADVSKGFLLGLDKGQLVLFRKVPGSYKLVGIFPPVNEEDAKTPVVARIEKGSPKAFKPSSAIDPETGIVTLRLSIPTSSSMTDDVFSVQVKIRVKGDLSGDWRVMKD